MIMFRDIGIYKRECLICNKKEIYKFEICKECYENLSFKEDYHYDFKYLDEVYIVFNYNRFLKSELWKYKYQEKTYLYKFFGEALIDEIFKFRLNKEYDFVTFIPLSTTSLKKRGYNQSQLMAKYICDNTFMEFKNILYKNRDNKKQANLTRIERYDNVKDIFSSRISVIDKNILIVDDVITTGYTLDFAAKALKEKGAKKVAAIVAAKN